MPWFKIDDASHSHPKFMAAGNAALGLWLRCGAYSAQHLTEGHIPAAVAKAYGTPPQARKLVAVGLWHESGHDCPRCPQPAAGFVVHDFFEGGRNSTREQVETSRKGAAERAAKHRESKKDVRSARESDANRTRIDDEPNADRVRNEPQFPNSTAGQQGSSQRTGLEGGAAPHATATPCPPTSFGSRGAAAADPPIRAYDTLGDLKQAIRDAGINGVSWNLQASQIERVRQVRDRIGIPLMVSMAVSNASYRGIPGRASAWIEDWEGLEPASESQPGVTRLPVVRQQPASPQAARREASRNVLDRLTDELRAAAGGEQ